MLLAAAPGAWAGTRSYARPSAAASPPYATFTDGQYRRYTLHPDGNRFAMSKEPESSTGDTVVMIFNFFDELRRVAPVKR